MYLAIGVVPVNEISKHNILRLKHGVPLCLCSTQTDIGLDLSFYPFIYNRSNTDVLHQDLKCLCPFVTHISLF